MQLFHCVLVGTRSHQCCERHHERNFSFDDDTTTRCQVMNKGQRRCNVPVSINMLTNMTMGRTFTCRCTIPAGMCDEFVRARDELSKTDTSTQKRTEQHHIDIHSSTRNTSTMQDTTPSTNTWTFNTLAASHQSPWRHNGCARTACPRARSEVLCPCLVAHT